MLGLGCMHIDALHVKHFDINVRVTNLTLTPFVHSNASIGRFPKFGDEINTRDILNRASVCRGAALPVPMENQVTI